MIKLIKILALPLLFLFGDGSKEKKDKTETKNVTKTTKTSKTKRGGIVNFLWKIFWLIVALMIFAILALILTDKIASHPWFSEKQKIDKVDNTAQQRTAVTDTTVIFAALTPTKDMSIYFSDDSTLIYSSGPVLITYKGIHGTEKIPYSGNGVLKDLPKRKSLWIRVISPSSKQETVVVKKIKTHHI